MVKTSSLEAQVTTNSQGGADDDILRGGAGNDQVTGGTGIDTFVLATGEGKDTFTDFVVGTDLIGLTDNLTFGTAQHYSRWQ
jgi:Ca2+-binding RTX toxin-like protein